MVTTLNFRVTPATGGYELFTPEAAAPNGTPNGLSQAGVFGGAADFNFGGVPVGAAIVGGLTAGFFDAIINLFPTVDIPGVNIPTNVRNAIIFFIASWAAQTEPVRNFLGRSGAEAASLILAADGVQNLVNLRGILSGIVGARGGGGGAGGGGAAANAGAGGQDAILLANQARSRGRGSGMQADMSAALRAQAARTASRGSGNLGQFRMPSVRARGGV